MRMNVHRLAPVPMALHFSGSPNCCRSRSACVPWRGEPLEVLILTVGLQYIMAEIQHTYCDQCGHKSGFTRFCPHCGKPGTDRPHISTALRPGYCPGCGEEYPTVTSQYCSVCGAPRSGSTPDNIEPHCCSCGSQIATA